jgi:hypothetical protein
MEFTSNLAEEWFMLSYMQERQFDVIKILLLLGCVFRRLRRRECSYRAFSHSTRKFQRSALLTAPVRCQPRQPGTL